MIFTLFLSLILILVPQIVHSPSRGGATLKNEPFILETVGNIDMILEQKEGDSLKVGLPRAERRGPQKKEASRSLGIETTARAALVMDSGTGAILFEKNYREKLPLASITKLMTALVFLENNPGWDKRIKLTKADAVKGGIFYVHAGEEVTVKDLFYMSLVGSVNNATMALARSTGMSESEFVAKMNQKAQDLKLKNIFFVDLTGLDPANLGTAEDVAKLVLYAMENDKIREAALQKKYVFRSKPFDKIYYVKNTNELLWSFLNETPYQIFGGKTGYIEEAGYNLAIAVGNNGYKIIVVALGSEKLESRFQEVKGLSVWAFENYRW